MLKAAEQLFEIPARLNFVDEHEGLPVLGPAAENVFMKHERIMKPQIVEAVEVVREKAVIADAFRAQRLSKEVQEEGLPAAAGSHDDLDEARASPSLQLLDVGRTRNDCLRHVSCQAMMSTP